MINKGTVIACLKTMSKNRHNDIPFDHAFLCGDLMTGRGIDQILPISNTPILIERHVRDARVYIALAGKPNGIIPNAVDYRYVWGEALEILDGIQPTARIVNLETSTTERRFLATERHSLPDASRECRIAKSGCDQLLCSLK